MADPVSTLWRYSAFERQRGDTLPFAQPMPEGRSVLATTLQAELDQLQRRRRADDVVEVAAACVRRRESATLLLRLGELMCPVTVFPERGLYHAPRSMLPVLDREDTVVEIVGVEAPTVRAPSRALPADADEHRHFFPLAPLFWALAMRAPRPFLLPEISGKAAYRLASDFVPLPASALGAIGPALRQLRQEIAPLRAIARWPGMDMERAMRLLNGVYLQGGLMVLRTHPAARDDVQQTSAATRLADWFRR